MKRSLIFVVIAILVISVSGCSLLGNNAASNSQNDSTTDNSIDNTSSGDNSQVPTTQENQGKLVNVTLYFATEDNSAIKKESRDIQVKDGALLKACIQALLEGPKTPGLRKTIPEGTMIAKGGINLKNKVAIVDFTKEYATANDIAEITERISVVNTLAGIPGVEKVRILVEGKDLIGPSGKPLGEMGPATLDSEGKPIAGEIKTVTLYFANSNAEKVAAEKRKIELTKGELLEKAIFLELMKGPETKSLHKTIPEGTKLISIKTSDGLCTINLSSEFVENSPGGTASESMTINSVVNTLTELKYIKKVQFLIDGEKRKVYTHAIFDKPFTRNTDKIDSAN